jgi:serine/threonine protein kinase
MSQSSEFPLNFCVTRILKPTAGTFSKISHFILAQQMHVQDFTMCPDVTITYTNCLRSAFAPGTGGNNENLPPTNTTGCQTKLTSFYVETTGRFSDLIVSGQQFPRLNQLGKGAFGTVYQSQDPASGQKVALKVMKYDLADQEKRMFDREVEILASVRHETLLGMRGFMPFSKASPTNPPVIITELMGGGSLQSVISAAFAGRVPANWDDTHKWIVLYGTAAGMMTLHANNIIHRDLKPDNVLLAEDLRPKVADFGLGKFVSAGSQQQSIQGGTPGFMAPEAYEGNCSFASDVFSFGILIYVTLTNQRPFPESSHHVIAQKVVRGERPRVPSNVSPAFRELMESCWDHNPSCRPTFAWIVERLESPDFWTSATNVPAISQYQAEILPERAQRSPISNGLFGGHREEINQVLEGLFAKDMAFLTSIATHLAGKIPSQILAQKLSSFASTGRIPAELLQEAKAINGLYIYSFVIGLVNAYCDAAPDLTGWLRNNYQSRDTVNAFSTFLSGARRQQQQTLIGQLTRLLRDCPQILSCQAEWNSIVQRARAIYLGSTYLSLPDSELYMTIAPANVQGCLQ